jgi:enediyne biosynthesis protein E4
MAGLAAPSNDRLGFGTTFLDADLDGNPDLLVANGHVSDLSTLGIPYKMRGQFFRNQGTGRFADESNWVGAYFQRHVLGRGIATADIDEDGRPDAVVCHIGDPAAVLVNRTVPHGNWLGLKLVGTSTNRSAINTKVRVELPDQSQYFEVGGGGTYLSSSDRRLIIGLGSNRNIRSLELEWPSGRKQRWDTLLIDRYHRIVEPF